MPETGRVGLDSPSDGTVQLGNALSRVFRRADAPGTDRRRRQGTANASRGGRGDFEHAWHGHDCRQFGVWVRGRARAPGGCPGNAAWCTAQLVATVFAGFDDEATSRARGYFNGFPPSSPSIALLQNGKVVYMLERGQIENRDAPEIAAELTRAFDRFCTAATASAPHTS